MNATSCPKLETVAQLIARIGEKAAKLCDADSTHSIVLHTWSGTKRSVTLFRLFQLAGVRGCNALRAQALF
jgi:hypothetical protein